MCRDWRGMDGRGVSACEHVGTSGCTGRAKECLMEALSFFPRVLRDKDKSRRQHRV